MSDELFREVDEEIRQDRFQQHWKRYGTLAALSLVVFLGAVIAVVVWRDAQQSAREADSARFLTAVVQEQSERDAAITALRDIAQDGTTGYRFLASLREATLLAEAGDVAEAVTIFDAVAADDAFSDPHRELARIFAVARGMEIMSAAEAEDRLSDFNTPTHPFRVTAREFLAVSAIRAGDDSRASELLRANMEDNETPLSARARASELLALTGN